MSCDIRKYTDRYGNEMTLTAIVGETRSIQFTVNGKYIELGATALLDLMSTIKLRIGGEEGYTATGNERDNIVFCANNDSSYYANLLSMDEVRKNSDHYNRCFSIWRRYVSREDGKQHKALAFTVFIYQHNYNEDVNSYILWFVDQLNSGAITEFEIKNSGRKRIRKIVDFDELKKRLQPK